MMTLLFGCGKRKEYIHGYIDAELAYMSSSKSGKLAVLNLERGDLVKNEDLLFELEKEPEKSALEQGQKKVEESRARLENAEKGQRPTELEAIESKIIQAKARYDLAQLTWQRQVDLVKAKAAPQSAVDTAKKDMDEIKGQIDELEATLKTAKLGSRIDEIVAARAQLQQAEADLERLQWEYDQKTVKSSVYGSVFDTYFEIGEKVAAFKPVLSLLVPTEIRAIFFVSEPELSQIKIGQKFEITCDGCKKKFLATISFIAPQAEFTPPVIYGRERRSDLVFRVEGKLDLEDAVQMHLGMPIEVKLIK